MGIQDLEQATFKEVLLRTVNIIADLYQNIETKKTWDSKTHKEISRIFNEEMPLKGSSIDSLITKIEKDVIENVAIHYSPHFYAWVTSTASQASIIGDMIASALNVNATTWLNAAAASEIEQNIIRWICEFISFDKKANGVLLSGGSMANLTALRVAIAEKCPYNYRSKGFDRERPLTFYVSNQNHFCIDKAIMSLGIGVENLRKISVNEDFTINIAELEWQIKADLEMGKIPIGVIGNAGTVNTGAVDSIVKLRGICKHYGLWLHLDAAYGGFAASTRLRKTKFKDLEFADSIAIDLHKWLFVPFECGSLLVKNPKALKQTFSYIPEYQKFEHDNLKIDFSEYSLQQSRSFKALKVWMNFKVYGSENLRNSIQHSITLMQYLEKLIKSSTDFELITPSSLSIVCFRYTTSNKNHNNGFLNELNRSIVKSTELDGRIFIRETTLNGIVVFRACCTNFRREKKHIGILLKVLREIGLKTITNKVLS